MVLLAFGFALGLKQALTWRSGRPPSAPLPELARTNLLHLSGVWFEKDHTNPFTGVMLEFYPDGAPMSRSVVSNGLLNGLSEGWYTNRQLQVRETYRTNYSDGLRTKWWPNGKKLSEATIVLGKIHGLYRRWYEDGALAEEIPMRDGEIEGLGRAYFESGSVKAEITYHDGKMVEQHTWKEGEHPAGSGTQK
jgi:antitoxin component YwqK of YwqJK toxin-antitoxin module